MTDTEPDTTTKVEETEIGYRMMISSTRGTGTRDQDKVTVEAHTETLDRLLQQQNAIQEAVRIQMDKRRLHKPDEDSDE